MTKRISVNMEDMEKGIASQCIYCPVARAINRKLQKQYYAFVEDSGIIIYEEMKSETNKLIHKFHPPSIVTEFIRMVDNFESVSIPFVFNINLPKRLFV